MRKFLFFIIFNLITVNCYADISECMLNKCPNCTVNACTSFCANYMMKQTIKNPMDELRYKSYIYDKCTYNICPKFARSQQCISCYNKCNK